MKIDRPGKTSIVVGKRVTFGAIIGGVVSFGVWMWNATHPEAQIPAEQAVGLTTVFTGISQVLIVNRYGITQ
jgi:hypothetical protein